MIIPALVRLYDRLISDGDPTVAAAGYSRQQISFKIVLNLDGSLHAIEPVSITTITEKTRRVKGQDVKERRETTRPAPLLLPGQSKPSGSGLNPCFLWDNSAYMLGFKPADPAPARTAAAFAAFRDKHLALQNVIADDGFRAVATFLAAWKPDRAAQAHPGLTDISTNFGVFQLRADAQYIHERPAIRAWWNAQQQGLAAAPVDAAPPAPSLVSGITQPIARLHEPRIKSVFGAQSSGATIVSFNQPAFSSYGKDQGANAPLGIVDAFKYCTALNRLTTDATRRVTIGGDTFVFWSEGAPKFVVDWFAGEFGDTQADVTARDAFLRAREGRSVSAIPSAAAPFYVLGLSPNMSRLSVRLWLASTVGEIVARLDVHHQALQLLPEPADQRPLTIRAIVNETAMAKGGFPDSDRVIPTLASAVALAILNGTAYPAALLSGILSRVRIDGLASDATRKDHRTAAHRRCSIIRAVLTRNHQMEVPVSIDPARTDPPYLLGRLFAVLEKTQENALGDINRSIKDSYFGSATATPAAVFPRLIKVAQHHLGKIDGERRGQRVMRDREIGEIVQALNGFPTLLNLEQQGLFVIGYYHQRQSYFTKKVAPQPV